MGLANLCGAGGGAMEQPLEILVFGVMYYAGVIIINDTINNGQMGANTYAAISAGKFFDGTNADIVTCKKACKAYVIPNGGKTTDWMDVTFLVGDTFTHNNAGYHPSTAASDYASMIIVYEEL